MLREEEGKMEHQEGFEEVLPGQIEARSFEIIGEELARRGICLKPEEEPVIKRAIHATADFDYASSLVFAPSGIDAGLKALKGGAVVVTDTNMAKAGINKRKLESLGGQAFCFMADEDVAERARKMGCTRAAASMEKAAALFGKRAAAVFGKRAEGGEIGGGGNAVNRCPVIVVVGNAPTALAALCRMIREGSFLPDLVVGVPVGFVNVVQSKELLLVQDKVPYIVARGRKGGSSVAAAVVNALLYQV